MSRQEGNLAVRATAVHTTRIITVPALQFIQIQNQIQIQILLSSRLAADVTPILPISR